jgi:hypothetical protein
MKIWMLQRKHFFTGGACSTAIKLLAMLAEQILNKRQRQREATKTRFSMK